MFNTVGLNCTAITRGINTQSTTVEPLYFFCHLIACPGIDVDIKSPHVWHWKPLCFVCNVCRALWTSMVHFCFLSLQNIHYKDKRKNFVMPVIIFQFLLGLFWSNSYMKGTCQGLNNNCPFACMLKREHYITHRKGPPQITKSQKHLHLAICYEIQENMWGLPFITAIGGFFCCTQNSHWTGWMDFTSVVGWDPIYHTKYTLRSSWHNGPYM